MNKEIKAVLYGDTGVGKTSIAHRACYQIFDELMIPTVGSATFNLEVNHGGTTTKFNLWDTAGQEIFQSLTPIYFRGAQFVILVFDIAQRSSFECLERSFDTVSQNAPDTVLYALVGNKSDLKDEPGFREAVSMQEIEQFCERIHSKIYVETSARTGKGVSDLFYALASAEGITWSDETGVGSSGQDSAGKCC